MMSLRNDKLQWCWHIDTMLAHGLVRMSGPRILSKETILELSMLCLSTFSYGPNGTWTESSPIPIKSSVFPSKLYNLHIMSCNIAAPPIEYHRVGATGQPTHLSGCHQRINRATRRKVKSISPRKKNDSEILISIRFHNERDLVRRTHVDWQIDWVYIFF